MGDPMVTVPSFQAPLSAVRHYADVMFLVAPGNRSLRDAARQALADYEAAQTPWTYRPCAPIQGWAIYKEGSLRRTFRTEQAARDYCDLKNAERSTPPAACERLAR